MHKVASPKPILACRELTKDFGNHKGIFDVSFSLEPNTVTGFVGPNGAGKSTTINILTGLTRAESGTLKIFGEPYSFKDFYRFASQVGVLYSELTLDERSTPEQVFLQSQALLGKDYTEHWQAMSALLELDVHKPIKKLSLGNKKKVGIVHALMHQPQLIIMDEPTSGLDPIMRERFVGLLRQAVGQGASVLLSSHDLAEVQEIADTIVIIKAGKVVLNTETEKVIGLAARTFQLIKPPRKLADTLSALKGVSNVASTESMLTFQAHDYERVTRIITDHNFYNFYIEKPGLEESFREFYE